MRFGLYLCCALLLCAAVWGQQSSSSGSNSPQQNSSPPAATKDSTSGPDQSGAPAPSKTNGTPAEKAPGPNPPPPRSDRVRADELDSGTGDSSSKDEHVDLSPPADDAKAHPKSTEAVANAEAESSGNVTEMHQWDPHRAAKDVEVGDFYFKRKNYRAAEERYRDALKYKDNDAIATIRLAECLEKEGIFDEAIVEYESYLKILPHGPEAGQAQKAIRRLKAPTGGPK